MDTDFYLFQCPHCQEDIIVQRNEINCAIFRHGVFKNNLQQILPHSPKNECDLWFEKDLIFGCGKPFELVIDVSNQPFTKICDYI
jgi:hypothetical protein